MDHHSLYLFEQDEVGAEPNTEYLDADSLLLPILYLLRFLMYRTRCEVQERHQNLILHCIIRSIQ
jgi:hypothetical protein